MKRQLLIVCCCLAWSSKAAGTPITLDACLQRADQRSSTVRSFEMAAKAADESLIISRTSFYPTLKLKAFYSLADNPERLIISGNSFAAGVPPQDVHISIGDRDSYGIGLYLQQPLYTGGNLTQSRRRAEFQAKAAQSDTSYQRTRVANLVKKIFSEVLVARQQVQALLKSLNAAKEQVRVVRERVQEGYAHREDLLTAEMEVSRVEAAWGQADNHAELTLSTLRKLIDATSVESIEPVGSLFKIHLTAPLSELQTLGLQKRADLKSSQSKVMQSSADVAIARSGYLPQVQLVGSYQRQPETAITRSDVWKIGAQAEWSLFEWGRTAAEVRRATALEQRELFLMEEERKNVVLEVERYWRDVKSGESQLSAAEAHLISMEYTLGRVLDRYQEGLVKRADILLAESALWNAYADYIQTAARQHTTLASLEMATGAELTPWVEYKPLYQPAFGDISDRINQTARKKLPPPEPALLPTTTYPVEKLHVPPKGDKPAYLIQLGAYKSHKNAVKAREALAGNILRTTDPLTIINETGMFKVMAGPFRQKDDAIRIAKDMGVKDFLLKVTHGP